MVSGKELLEEEDDFVVEELLLVVVDSVLEVDGTGIYPYSSFDEGSLE